MLAIKKIPVITSPSNPTAPSADSYLQTGFTPVLSGASLIPASNNIVYYPPSFDKQLEITELITLGTAPELPQRSRCIPDSSASQAQWWLLGAPTTGALPTDYSHTGTSSTSSYKATCTPPVPQHALDLSESKSFMGELTGFIMFTLKAFIPLQDCCSLTKTLNYATTNRAFLKKTSNYNILMVTTLLPI